LGLVVGLGFELVFGLLVGLDVMLVLGLIKSCVAYLQCYLLRSLLVRYDYAPWDYIAFLDSCADRILLRKVAAATSSSIGCC
jgi:hypothetical protein